MIERRGSSCPPQKAIFLVALTLVAGPPVPPVSLVDPHRVTQPVVNLASLRRYVSLKVILIPIYFKLNTRRKVGRLSHTPSKLLLSS